MTGSVSTGGSCLWQAQPLVGLMAFSALSVTGGYIARVVIGDFKNEHNHRHRHSSLGYRTPAEYAAACRCTHTPVACEIN